MKKLSNTEAELKKAYLIKKRVIQQRKSRSVRWNSVLETEEGFFEYDLNIYIQHKISNLKLSIFLHCEKYRNFT